MVQHWGQEVKGKYSKLLEAEGRFGNLAEASFLTPFGRVVLLVSVYIVVRQRDDKKKLFGYIYKIRKQLCLVKTAIWTRRLKKFASCKCIRDMAAQVHEFSIQAFTRVPVMPVCSCRLKVSHFMGIFDPHLMPATAPSGSFIHPAMWPVNQPTASQPSTSLHYVLQYLVVCTDPLTSTWPHLRCDVGLEEGEYRENCLCLAVLCTIIMAAWRHKDMSSSYRSVNCIGLWSCLV